MSSTDLYYIQSPPLAMAGPEKKALQTALAAVLENKRSPRDDLVPAEQLKAEMALSIKSDQRFKQMDAFTRQKKAVPLPQVMLSPVPRPHTVAGGEAERIGPQGAEPSSPSSPSSPRTPGEGKGRQRAPGVNLSTLTGEERSKVPKALWQDSVDRSIKRLMVDFDLTDEPSCRLHHLERMHDWFVRHGPKGKAPAMPEIGGPSYLRAERNSREPAPAGSTQNLAGVLSPSSELMARMYSPRNYSRPVTRG
ncbi:unnamed protein product [Durusdinium trenchii]|uniref:Uncharacterized protein n=2 Tax=Durusdinium trenchii TaxID=1381693 RepID=A0ABP0N2B9_9DINO